MKSALTHTISRARRRGAAAALLDAAGRGFAFGSLVAVLVLVASRLAGHDLPWMLYPAIVLGGLLLGAIRAAADLPAAFDVALRLDRTLRLRDRLASAYALANGAPSHALRTQRSESQPRFDPEFAAMVRDDGEQLAAKIDVRSLAPLRINPAWGVGGVLSVVLFLGVLYVPVMAWGDGRADETAAVIDRERAEEERQRLRDEVEQIMEDLRVDEELAQLPETREELEALERLAEQLSQGGADPEETRRAREETAARLNELADQLNEQARRDFEAAQRLAERFAGMEPLPERPMTAQDFDEALRRGDFGAAAEALQEHLDRASPLTDEERRELAQHLRETADRADDIGAEEDAEFAERMAQLEQMLREFGLDEDSMRDAMEGDEEAQYEAMQRLQELLNDEEAAERLRRELERMREEKELQEQVKRDIEEMNEAMREVAEELDPQSEPYRESEPDRADPAHEGLEDPEDAPREEASEAAEPQPGDAERPEADDAPQGKEARESAERQREESRELGEEPGEEPVESPEGEQREEAVREAMEEGEGPEQEGVAREQEMQEPGEGEQQAGDVEDEEAQEQQRRSPSDAMREMEQRRQQAERRQQAAERARQRARELADSPEQRDLQRELQRQLARDTSGEPGREAADHARREQQRQRDAQIEDIDARTEDDDPGRVIAEWFSDEELAADPEVRRTQIEERVRRAQRVAERAVEDAAVPPRYHDFIRRYFGRFNERE